MNNVNLVGRLVKDVDLNYTAGSGKAVGKFTIAVKRAFKKDESDFLNCVVFGKTAEIICQYFFKGDMIGITGSIRNNNYNKDDGTMVYQNVIIVESFSFCGGTKGTNKNNNDFGGLTAIEDFNGSPFE